MLYGIPGCSDRATAFITVITYWTFRCRDLARSPASGINTWSYLQKAIEQAAIPSRTIARYQSILCDKLVVPALYPQKLIRLLSNPASKNVILFGDKTDSGVPSNLRELTQENIERVFVSPDDLLSDLQLQGISERHILGLAKPVRLGGIPHVIALYCQVAHEEYKNKVQDDDILDVEVTNAD